MPNQFRIAVVAFKRAEILQATLDALSECIGIDKYSVSIFVDSQRNKEEKEAIDQVVTLLRKHKINQLVKSLAVRRASRNLGAWANKLRALNTVFEEADCDYVILLEDDVCLCSDGLQFFEYAYSISSKQEQLSTVSAYSSNFQRKNEKLVFNKALTYISDNEGILYAVGARNWPFPWGVALTKTNFCKLVERGWNGNDNHMGEILRANQGVDIFPIITRSQHCGEESSITGARISLLHHVVTSESIKQRLSEWPQGSSDLNYLYDVANAAHVNLMNDYQLRHTLLVSISDDQTIDGHIQKFSEYCQAVEVLSYFVVPGEAGKEIIKKSCTRIYSSKFVINLHDNAHLKFAKKNLDKFPYVQVLYSSDYDEILKFMQID
ncbi:MAG: hypothetical protein IT292_06780 [Deltaproteobacteria bacterium]|nr:hypothetical protein [Deltaproteobacteria bacterium]